MSEVLIVKTNDLNALNNDDFQESMFFWEQESRTYEK